MERTAADAVWLNARIYTFDQDLPWASAMAVRDGKIIALGSDEDMTPLTGPGTDIHDNAGDFIMPGLIDTHVHAIWGGARDSFEAYVGYEASLQDIAAAIKNKAEGLPPGSWIDGGPWRLDHMNELSNVSPRQFLDEIAPDNPVVFTDATKHNSWVNSAALTVAGINKDSKQPENGRIGFDAATGEPDGLLIEAASGEIRSKLSRSGEETRQALNYARDQMHAYGITAIKEPMAGEADLGAYTKADQANELNLHVFCHIAKRSPIRDKVYTMAKMLELRDRYRSTHVRSSGVKLFLDGVAPSRTAAFLEPYGNASPCGCTAESFDADALLMTPPTDLGEEVAELDRAGFLVKMHAVGDRAVRAGLDAIEIARRENGDSGLRHEIAHTAFVSEPDLKRFVRLGAIAEVSPKLWFPNPVTAGQIVILGKERAQRCHPIASLLGAGAEITYGSDWPAAAPDASPWTGLSGMLTRQDATGKYPGSVGPGEAIDLKEALKIFVTNGARALNMENSIGRLATGMSADFILLDRDIFQVHAAEIAETKVIRTVFEGKIVHALS